MRKPGPFLILLFVVAAAAAILLARDRGKQSFASAQAPASLEPPREGDTYLHRICLTILSTLQYTVSQSKTGGKTLPATTSMARTRGCS